MGHLSYRCPSQSEVHLNNLSQSHPQLYPKKHFDQPLSYILTKPHQVFNIQEFKTVVNIWNKVEYI